MDQRDWFLVMCVHLPPITTHYGRHHLWPKQEGCKSCQKQPYHYYSNAAPAGEVYQLSIHYNGHIFAFYYVKKWVIKNISSMDWNGHKGSDLKWIDHIKNPNSWKSFFGNELQRPWTATFCSAIKMPPSSRHDVHFVHSIWIWMHVRRPTG
jgi:hypothetical protein